MLTWFCPWQRWTKNRSRIFEYKFKVYTYPTPLCQSFPQKAQIFYQSPVRSIVWCFWYKNDNYIKIIPTLINQISSLIATSICVGKSLSDWLIHSVVFFIMNLSDENFKFCWYQSVVVESLFVAGRLQIKSIIENSFFVIFL